MYRYFAAFFLVLMGLVACVAIAVWWIENYVAFMMIGGVIVYFLCAYFSHIVCLSPRINVIKDEIIWYNQACKDLIGIPLIIHRTNKGGLQHNTRLMFLNIEKHFPQSHTGTSRRP